MCTANLISRLKSVMPLSVNHSNQNYHKPYIFLRLLLIVKFKVAVESQPTALVVANVYVPLSVYVAPFQSKLSQAVAFSSEEELLLIVKFKEQ